MAERLRIHVVAFLAAVLVPLLAAAPGATADTGEAPSVKAYSYDGPASTYDDSATTRAAELAPSAIVLSSGVQRFVCEFSDWSYATNAIPRPGQLADDVAEAVGGVAKPATRGTGQVITIPQGNRQIVIRIMEEGGGRTNYYRVSVAGKEGLTVGGEASVDRALTHIPIGESSLDDILRLVSQLTGGGG
jgi:hypothetical protein